METAAEIETARASQAGDEAEKRAASRRLTITFILLLIVGLCNKIFVKLMTFPLYNYPVFVNLISSFIYLPTSFAYILPMILAGRISKAERQIPQSVFIVMGALDSITGIMQLFATNFIASGSLLILLQQASIPLSMLISRVTLDTRYSRAQYAGAVVVIIGIGIIIAPSLSGSEAAECHSLDCNMLLWSSVLVLSCVPMCISTVYKERALAKIDINPIYLNGFVCLYQFLLSIPLSIPAAPLTGISMREVPQNIADGWGCYLGYDAVGLAEAAKMGKPVDHCWPVALLYLSAYLIFNQLYNILIILMLKYGSANLLYLAMTLLVPLGNVAFALPFMPNAQPLTVVNLIGLMVIMAGLFAYRFLDKLLKPKDKRKPDVLLTKQDHMQQARRAAVIVGSASTGNFALEGIQYLIDDMALASPMFEKLKRSPAQIRAGYLFKLGMRHSSSAQQSPLMDSHGYSYDESPWAARDTRLPGPASADIRWTASSEPEAGHTQLLIPAYRAPPRPGPTLLAHGEERASECMDES